MGRGPYEGRGPWGGAKTAPNSNFGTVGWILKIQKQECSLGLGHAPKGPYKGQGLGDSLGGAIFPPTGLIRKFPKQECSLGLELAQKGPYKGQ